MRVGFLSIDERTADMREARIALFDNGHSADVFTAVEACGIDTALKQMREVCDVIVVEGNTAAFYDTYKDTLSLKPEMFELDGKLHCVTAAATPEYIRKKLVPIINKKAKKRFGVIVFKTYGKTADELKVILKDYMGKKSKVKIEFFPDYLECEVHARCNANMAKEEMNEISIGLNELLYNCTYSYTRMSIEERVAQILREEKLKLKIAESFTGGALGAAFTAIPGASEYLMEDLVTYTVGSKNKRLGVPLEVIAEKGVVSGDTAYNMALGLMTSGDCDIAVATTGNAGPTVQSGTAGLCFISIGITSEKSIAVIKYVFDGDREKNIKSGVKTALFLLYESLVTYRAKQSRERAAQQQQARRYGENRSDESAYAPFSDENIQ